MARGRIPAGGFGLLGVSKLPDAHGRHRAWVTIREHSGQTRTLTVFATTKAKAQNRLKSKIEEWQSSGGSLPSDPTVETLVNIWLAARSVTDLSSVGEIRTQTKAGYDYYIRAFIVPGIGRLKVRELRSSQAKAFLASLISDDAGYTTARLCRTILNQAFDFAAQDDLVRANPIASVRLPVKNKKPPRALSDKDLLTLRNAIRDWRSGPGQCGPPKSEHLQDVFEVMLGTALRIGECLALTWGDVDLDAKRARIHATLVEERGQRDLSGIVQKGRFFYQDRRKSGGGEYEIELPAFVVDILLRRSINNPAFNPIDAVFVSRKGTWLRMGNMRRSFGEAKRAAGIDVEMEWTKPHSLRKTAVTLLQRLKSLEDASAQAGHSELGIGCSGALLADALTTNREPSLERHQHRGRRQTMNDGRGDVLGDGGQKCG
ncbi:tyrosine-type recombinase/integrase [Paenarthrobacter sp. Z7-10]|nr:tyrosine-type recombinase/integrase [Paenarthrobacter sp. Z7-10]